MGDVGVYQATEHAAGKTPTRVGLLGAGAQAREVASYLPSGTEVFWAVSATHLDLNATDQIDIASPSSAARDLPVVGAVGAPALRRELVAAWPGKRFLTVVSTAAYIDSSCLIGDGVVIAPGAVLTVDVVVGDHCQVNIGATISHDVRLGSFVTVGPGAHISGHVHLGDGVFVGVGASISNNVSIASGVVIAAGATVLADVMTPNAVVAGVPASVVKTRNGWLDVL
ncbi:hypothetical protein DQP58_06860 [Mycobacterium colombiense]|uniref:Acetyltransferase n=1 Tax=Mycobacterium colombiense TaxID=339268 RepID=A0A329KRQ1_9MYCO|nr:hypothetical protein [Mycobacterium colombiense]RAU97839.1 hypothetical protein DQP58_06860 [Mycobacterium colombiense]